MASRVVWQPNPVDLSKFADNTDDKACSGCGGSETYSYRGKPQWRYQNGSLLCKKCNDKQLRADKKEIDLSKLKVNKKEDELTFSKLKKAATSKHVMQRWEDMTPEERGARRERFEKALEKKAKRKFKSVPLGEYYPYVQKVVYVKDGVCDLCGCGMSYQRGVKFIIPGIKTMTDEFALCSVCLSRVNKATMAYKANDDINGCIHSEIGIRNLMRTNKTMRVTRDRNDNRSSYEIFGELRAETKKELGIPDDDLI